jgi:hypothetical protein
MRRAFIAILSIFLLPISIAAQGGFSVLEIMNKDLPRYEAQRLVIVQDPALDTLVSRHIMANASKEGVDGWRIQIYRGGHRTANEDANKVRARFMESYPNISTYLTFDRPNWFKVKVGTTEPGRKLPKTSLTYSKDSLMPT